MEKEYRTNQITWGNCAEVVWEDGKLGREGWRWGEVHGEVTEKLRVLSAALPAQPIGAEPILQNVPCTLEGITTGLSRGTGKNWACSLWYCHVRVIRC